MLSKNETLFNFPNEPVEQLSDFRDKMDENKIRAAGDGFTARKKIVLLPTKITPKLAYFIGYLHGDGCITSDKKYVYFTDESLEQLELINEISEDMFGVSGVIRPTKNQLQTKQYFNLRIGSLVLNAYLQAAFKIPRGNKTTLEMPIEIKQNNELLKFYLSGVFDADGTMPKEPERVAQLAFVDVTLRQKELVEEIKAALERLGVKTLKIYCRKAKSPNSETISTTWELRIRSREQLKNFLNNIPVVHPEKRLRAEKIIKRLMGS